MSRKLSEEEYKRQRIVRLKHWLSGEKDLYLDNMEVIPYGEQEPDKKRMELYEHDLDEVMTRTYDTKHNRVYRFFQRFYKMAAVLCCVALILILVVEVSYLPPVGSASNPASNEVAAKYIEDGLKDTGAVNIVTGMILDYRAFDTFGESNVLFIATCTVLILMRNDKKKGKGSAEEEERRDSFYEPKKDAILQMGARILVPIIMLFGIYIILNGHLSPGGGFSGGAVIGSGLILYLNAFGFRKTERFFNGKVYRRITVSALMFYCLAKSYSFFTGANHLESGIPLGNPGDIISSGLILPLNICVGMVVACTMYAFYTLFRKGGI